MKNSKWLLLAGLAIVLMTFGCQKQMGMIEPEGDVGTAATSTLPIQYNPGGSWFTYFLWAPPGPTGYRFSIGNDSGTNGTVVIEKIGLNVQVTFSTFGDWYIQKTHVDVATTKAGLAHNNQNNLVPGKFRFQGPAQSIPYPQQVVMTFAWKDSWTDVSPLYVAALANVCEGEYVDGEWRYWNFNTACGANEDTLPRYKELKLPTGLVELCRVGFPFSDSNTYWQIGLSGITGSYNVWNGDQWKGWCAERERDLQGCHWVTLIDSRTITPADGDRLYKNGEWDRVNWLLNHKDLFPRPPLSWNWQTDPVPDGTWPWNEYQDVIHSLLGEYPAPPPDPHEAIMYWAAVNNGDNYKVPVGGWVAVVGKFQTDDEEHQMVFIEVDP